MNQQPQTSGTGNTSNDERMQLSLIALAFVAFGGVGIFWRHLTTWALNHHVLLPPGPQTLLTLPSSNGAGLDLARLLLVAAALLTCAALAVSALARRRARRAAEVDDRVR